MNQIHTNIFNDIKKYRIFLQENICLYYLPYSASHSYLESMYREIIDLYPNLEYNTSSKIKLKQDEFILSRWLYNQVMKTEFNRKDSILEKNQDSSLVFPDCCRVSLSHKKGDVLLGISSTYPGVGVDIEREVKTSLSDRILTQDEYVFFNNNSISDELILGLIFSFKESIFKAFYPIVKKMLYFKEASVIDLDYKTHNIVARIFFDHPGIKEDIVRGKYLVIKENSHTNIITVAWIEN